MWVAVPRWLLHLRQARDSPVTVAGLDNALPGRTVLAKLAASMAETSISEATAPESLAALMRQRAFLLFWISRFLTVLAVQAQGVTIAWQVYAVARQRTSVESSAFLLGMIGLAQFLPLFAFSLIAGDAADRHDRRGIIRICLVVEIACVAALTLLTIRGNVAFWPVCALAVVFGMARAFFGPASTALAPTLVPRVLLPRAIAWNSLAWQGGSIAGPALGGLMCAISPAASYVVSAVLYAAAIAAMALVRARTPQPRHTASRITLIKEGLAYVWRQKIVFGSISLDLVAVLLGGATALLPVYAKDVLHVGPGGFGLLRASPAVGAAVVAMWLAAHPIRRAAGIKMFAGVALFGMATAVFAVSHWMALSMLCLALLGGGDMISVFVRHSLVQIVTPDAMRGRVAAVSTLFIGASNELGEFESGVAARLVGPIAAALIGGLGALAATGLWAKLFPELRKADRLG
jgi:MFS family permease